MLRRPGMGPRRSKLLRLSAAASASASAAPAASASAASAASAPSAAAAASASAAARSVRGVLDTVHRVAGNDRCHAWANCDARRQLGRHALDSERAEPGLGVDQRQRD